MSYKYHIKSCKSARDSRHNEHLQW